MNNIITFIIPTIGRDTLINTLKSLEVQTDDSWLAIVIFDGIPSNIDYTNPKVTILQNPEKTGKDQNSAGNVRNYGMIQVTTKWIAFVDDDDIISNDYVELFNDEINKYPYIDVIIFRMLNNSNTDILPPLDCTDFEIDQVGISFAIKTKIFTSGLKFIPSGTEDFDYLDRIRENNYKIMISPYITYFVRNAVNDYIDVNNIFGNRVLINCDDIGIEKFTSTVESNTKCITKSSLFITLFLIIIFLIMFTVSTNNYNNMYNNTLLILFSVITLIGIILYFSTSSKKSQPVNKNNSIERMNDIIPMKYIYISIGYNCSPRTYIKHKLKMSYEDGYKSCPFDLCISNYNAVKDCITTDFEHFFDNLHLVPGGNAEGDRKNAGNGNMSIINKYGIIFNYESPTHSHLFKDGANDDNYYVRNNFELFKKRYLQRINNFRNYIKENDKIIFLYTKYDEMNKDEMLQLLNSKYENKIFVLTEVKDTYT